VFRNRAKTAAIDVMNLHILTPNPAFQKADGCEIGKQAEITQKKTLNILEVKLNKLYQRNNEMRVANEELKKEIDHMRKRNKQCKRAHSLNEDRLAELKERIEEEMKEATLINDRKDQVFRLKDFYEIC